MSEPHGPDSHNHLRDREFTQLTWKQKQAARAQAKMNPLATVNEMTRNIERGAKEKEKIPFDKVRSMKRVVRQARDEACEEYIGGTAQTGKIEDLWKACHSKSLATAINTRGSNKYASGLSLGRMP